MNPKTFGDRYEVGELLGYGGMAEVRKARDNRLHREVAVKILRSDLARDQTFQARFRREAQSAAALNHGAIVAVYDTGTDDSTTPPTPYIVMEFVEGQTLRDLLRAKTTLEPHQAMRITGEICAALDFSHRNGIVHRDVKPGNVMITPAGRVKVMDFGIARAVSDTAATMTATAAVIGTAQYLSPEQARGESVDARSDVYAVGCVLYELLTGSPPFVGDSPVAVAYQHVRENPKRPSQVTPGISRELDAITLKALSKNPANRYQSAAAMQEDLDRALTGQKIAATPVMTEEEATELISTTPPVPHDDDEPEPAHSGGVRARTWALLGALLVAAIVAAFLIIPNLGDDEPAQVDVPSLAGMTEEEATAKLKEDGLKLGKVTSVVSALNQVDKVIDQSPSDDEKADKGAAVDIEVGAGPELKAIPGDIVGKTQAEVEQLFSDLGLNVSPISQDHPSTAGTVVDTSPKPGQSVPEGSTVTIFVSTGQVTAPDVVGLTEAAAVKTLTDLGFANVSTTQQDDSATAGTVISQDPAPGKVDVTTPITITVSTGKVLADIPNVTGTLVDQAKATLAQAGFKTVVEQPQPTADYPPGTVLSQNPPSGKIDVTTSVTLVVAAPPPATSSSSSSPSTTTPPND